MARSKRKRVFKRYVVLAIFSVFILLVAAFLFWYIPQLQVQASGGGNYLNPFIIPEVEHIYF